MSYGELGVGVIGMHVSSWCGGKFCYCNIGSLNDPNFHYSQLIIGEVANILGDKTPFSVFIF
jgi:hypothetical protein